MIRARLRRAAERYPRRLDGGDVLAMHIFSEPKPLRERDPSVPEVLAALIGRMMAKDQAERPTMAVVAQELEKMATLPVIQGTPVVALAGSTATDSGNHSSSLATLSAALGQSGSMKAVPKPQRRWPAVAALGLGLIGVGGLAVHYGLRSYAPAVQPAPKVYWTLNTIPVQAQVIRKSDGQVVGTTPWADEPRPGTGRQIFTLRAPGYAEQEVELDEHASASPTVALKQLAPGSATGAADGGAADPRGSADAGAPAPQPDLSPASTATPPTGPGPGTVPTAVPGVREPGRPFQGTPQRWQKIKPRDSGKTFTDDDIKTLDD